MSRTFILTLLCSLLFFRSSCFTITDTLNQADSLSVNQTIVSASDKFVLGFFNSSDSSVNRYLGIWFNLPIKTVVWIANRNNPLYDTSGILKISENLNLELLSGTNSIIWASMAANNSIDETEVIAQLLDTGNLVLKYKNDNDPESYIWQSFDYPTDTLLADMKLGWNKKTGLNRNLTSWKNSSDPSTGQYTMAIDPRGFAQMVVEMGSKRLYRAGSWNGIRFTGIFETNTNPFFAPFFIDNNDEVYVEFDRGNGSVITRFEIASSGTVQQLAWSENTLNWTMLQTVQKDRCDEYNVCGVYGVCNMNELPICSCLPGFMPKSQKDWEFDWTGGCVRKTQLDCLNGDGFVKISNMKTPDSSWSFVNITMTIKECAAECLKNCSCEAYAISEIINKGGCVMWFSDLIDIRIAPANGQELYLRQAASELEKINDPGKKRRLSLILSVSLGLGILLLGLAIWLIWRARGKQREKPENNPDEESTEEIQNNNLELPIFSFLNLSTATNGFSMDNKIGEGGFGPVYKGILENGQEIAVKRLSDKSKQGSHEFKNEVIMIAKLQHRNLVRLLGYSVQRQETILAYEYMPNKSLDLFIFDRERRKLINWKERINIVIGIAQGLLYLHRDSRLRIIHRDLKASNILLDKSKNPKISDFGMARIFGGDQTEASTDRVVGTYGYMAPEYAMDGLFSIKSDVFSFGVVILEILSGQRNRGFNHYDHDLNLLGHAWKLWNEGTASDFIDKSIEDPLQATEVLRCMHVALLCVQQRPEDRPDMQSVVLMLSSKTVRLLKPNQPGFYNERSLVGADSLSSGVKSNSNDVTITCIQAR